MAGEETLRRLREHIATEFGSINSATRSRIERLWLNAGSWRDADVARLTREAWSIVQASMLDIAKREASYQALAIAAQTGAPERAKPLSKAAAASIIESPLERFAQPATAIYAQLAAGKPLREAVEVGARQAASIASMALVDVRAAQAERSWRESTVKVTRFRRTLGGGACEFCARVIGAGRKTYGGEPRPLHRSCDCGYEPVVRRVSATQAAIEKATAQKSQRQAAARKARTSGAEAKREYLLKQREAAEAALTAAETRLTDLAKHKTEAGRRARQQLGVARQRFNAAHSRLEALANR